MGEQFLLLVNCDFLLMQLLGERTDFGFERVGAAYVLSRLLLERIELLLEALGFALRLRKSFRQLGSLLALIPGSCTLRGRFTIKALLCCYCVPQCRCRLLQFAPQIGDGAVPLPNLGLREFALVAGVAQLLFQRRFFLQIRLRSYNLGRAGAMPNAHAICGYAEGNRKQDAGCIKQPDTAPGRFAAKRKCTRSAVGLFETHLSLGLCCFGPRFAGNSIEEGLLRST